MLSSCQQLNELQILNGKLVRDLAADSLNSVTLMPLLCTNVRTLVLDVFANENPNTLKELLVKFPNVKKLQMTQRKESSSGSEKATNKFLCEYIKANNGSLKVRLFNIFCLQW